MTTFKASHRIGLLTLYSGFLLVVLISALSFEQPVRAQQPTDYNWQLPVGFPVPKVPDYNPISAEKVELGRYLFYDVRLSGNGTYACASCHQQALAFSDGRPVAVGSTGQNHSRNSMSLTNIAYNSTLTWANPTLTELERQVLVPMFGEFPVELGITGHEVEILSRLREDTRYPTMFAAAFPTENDGITFTTISQALSAFVRALISGNSAFDRYVYQKDLSAMSKSALRGMNLFFSERLECNHCHTGFNFTLSTAYVGSVFVEKPFFNTGLYNLDGKGAFPQGNTGLREITGRPEDMGKFRPPTLRNIALTAPYMHDGTLATLRDVLKFYGDGGRVIESGPNAGDGRANPFKSQFVVGFTLTDSETQDMLNFFDSLTDEQFITDPRFSDPFVKPLFGGTPYSIFHVYAKRA